MNVLILAGNDKLGRTLARRVNDWSQVRIVFDRSSGVLRILRLLIKGSLGFDAILKMSWAEWSRPTTPVDRSHDSVNSNCHLLQLITRFKIDRVYLFRASLIIQPNMFPATVQCFNVHCASLPAYRGLAAIHRALSDCTFEQHATLHRITARIDEGEILATKSYRLNPKLSYRENEHIAYDAGIELLVDHLRTLNLLQLNAASLLR